MINEIEMTAYAKVNLALAVTSRRKDGYHNIQTIFQSISLSDMVKVRLVPEKGIRCDCGSLSGEKNLAYGIAEKFLCSLNPEGRSKHLAETGIEITIDKHIPLEAGLGGGSSDAAAVLKALNLLYGKPLTEEGLLSIASQCGSDTAFCLAGGTQWGEGTGTELEPLPEMPPVEMIVVKPLAGVNTGLAYQLFDEQAVWGKLDQADWRKALQGQDRREIGRLMQNSLEDVSIKIVSEIGEIKKLLIKAGCIGALMSGSGSAVFGIVRDAEHGKFVKDILGEKGFSDSWLVRTIRNSEMVFRSSS
ncbi:4-diphosphocytidyl-2-C-methyl-D-erythritolkinase [Syntrophobotulus glycolicus DSM 8271]|uniref:4-diphosphocytidyl-2-C-methyl-D-erythritol kinase n=1 Tax=Syntrophobotulus glycolicus (strain DSM 8271 / FlGlyR) TaxID=645991 RepID=F0SW75_SYNGF|nr:4-(cytidine 5'-diphospho)-2-C-methyl-D-erythritol kinase [Syntrophobotulus glycolicus]ADY54561.1 4-diphosphocytidyl-2-C-methyl-D-erythritolkinase [Syntrophobotulus glycolicus DSM 8271]